MKKTHFKVSPGFSPLLIIIIIALVIAGIYYVKYRSPGSVDFSGSNQSLRSLLNTEANTSCTFSSIDGDTSTKGTVFVSGGKMQGEFMTSVKNGAVVMQTTSHMIRMGEDVYVWSDAAPGQGFKMSLTNVDPTTARGQGNVDWDAKGDFECSPWTPDESKFVLPPSVDFKDIKLAIPAGKNVVDVNANLGAAAGSLAGQCAACDQVPDGAAKEQCKQALGC